MKDYPKSPKVRHKRAVFIDRDGTINEDTNYPHKIEDIILIPKAIDGLRILSQLNLDIIVISNQGGIALNLFKREQMSQFNNELRKIVEKHGGRIDAFYYCPHFERKSLPVGEKVCFCSKPSPGMLIEAAEDYKIDLCRSFVVGDRTSDVVAGKATKCTTFLVRTGAIEKNNCDVYVRPNYYVDDLYNAALIIKSNLKFVSKMKNEVI